MDTWQDWVTGRQLPVPDAHSVRARAAQEVADLLARHPDADPRVQADVVAGYWSDTFPDRYLFPLSWGLDSSHVPIPVPPGSPLRAGPFHLGQPHLLPCPYAPTELWPEVALDRSLAHLLDLDDADRHAKRLAALLEPVPGLGRAPSPARADLPATLCVVGADAIQSFLFEGPGLPEMRGASALLQEATDQAKQLVQGELGPEAVLRAAGSALVFVAPPAWADRLINQVAETFLRETHYAIPVSSGSEQTTVHELSKRYDAVARQAWQRRTEDRLSRWVGTATVLPFEARCDHCRRRPAEFALRDPDEERALVCRVCLVKRERGRDERVDNPVLGELLRSELLPREPPQVARRVTQLILRNQHGRLALAWGDGNNFGALGRVDSMAKIRHWSKRVELATTRALAAALLKATEQDKNLRCFWPFEVLVVGGDDIGFLIDGALAAEAACTFLTCMDQELSGVDRDHTVGFSLGLALANVKAPLRELREFAEDTLLRWAKEAYRARQGEGPARGTLAFWHADGIDQLPVGASQQELLSQSLQSAGPASARLTFRPYTAAEFRRLLHLAETVDRQGWVGPLQQLVAGARTSSASASDLYFHYQRQRASDTAKEFYGKVGELYEELLQGRGRHAHAEPIGALLVDLLEVVKTLRSRTNLSPRLEGSRHA